MTPKEKAEEIINVLTNRNGFNDPWYNLDGEIQNEIIDEIVNILSTNSMFEQIKSLKTYDVYEKGYLGEGVQEIEIENLQGDYIKTTDIKKIMNHEY